MCHIKPAITTEKLKKGNNKSLSQKGFSCVVEENRDQYSWNSAPAISLLKALKQFQITFVVVVNEVTLTVEACKALRRFHFSRRASRAVLRQCCAVVLMSRCFWVIHNNIYSASSAVWKLSRFTNKWAAGIRKCSIPIVFWTVPWLIFPALLFHVWIVEITSSACTVIEVI